MSNPRFVIADDNALVLEQIATTLNGRRGPQRGRGRLPDDTVVPDLIVLDISMPLMTGLRAAEQLRERGCCAPIIFLTVQHDEEFLRAAMAAGGLSYVLKSRMTELPDPSIACPPSPTFYVLNNLSPEPPERGDPSAPESTNPEEKD